MSQVNIYFEKRKASKVTGLAPLVFQIYINGSKITIPSGEKAKAFKNGLVVKTDYHYQINERLAEKRNALQKAVDEGETSKEKLLSVIDPKKQVQPDATQTSFFQYIDDFYEANTGIKSHNYLRKLNQIKSALLRYNKDLDWSDFTNQFYTKYKSTLVQRKLLENSIWEHFKYIKILCANASRDGIKVPKDYEKWKANIKPNKPFWLSWDEIELIDSFEPKKEGRKIVKDVFIFACNTGLRFSDFSKVTKENIVTEKDALYLKILVTKTSTDLKIALNRKAIEILERYDYNLPAFSQQKINGYIKEIAQEAGVTGNVEKVRKSGSERIRKTPERYKMISTHTARRSFARRWYEKGGDLFKLSKYLGHANIQTTMRYIGVDDDEINNEMIRIFD